MKKLEANAFLKQLIEEKEAELLVEGENLRDHFYQTYESLKPINFIKDMVKEIFTTPDIKTNIINSAIGLTSGLIANKIFIGKSHTH